jgi:hypothetical protein
MNLEIVKDFGAIAGIGGLALGVFLLLFRDIIRKNIFTKLPADYSYRLMRQIVFCVWSLAIFGISVWLLAGMQLTFGNGSPIINR